MGLDIGAEVVNKILEKINKGVSANEKNNSIN